MGLYLCVFDETGEEVDGLEVGSYADFNFFRDAVIAIVEAGNAGSVCPILNNHSDSDGEWTYQESEQLIKEIDYIGEIFAQHPPVEFNSGWKSDVARTFGINPKCLADCFFDIDGEPLLVRLQHLAATSVAICQPILFQ